PHTFLRISSFGSPVALPFVSFGTPSGHYDDRTDVALQNRTDHELSTIRYNHLTSWRDLRIIDLGVWLQVILHHRLQPFAILRLK
ncbi:MAG: hypothetical protein SCG77_00645, partial [Nitrosomonadaceae bacterium]|nr:hypothetical protein [Nitrosomonadaceae bacterium]